MAELAQTSRGPVNDISHEEPGAAGNVDAFLHDAVLRFQRAEEAEAINRQLALDDLRFKNGDQWPEAIKSQRTIDKRPCLTINKMKTFVHQITNDQRQNRPAINVSPVGDKSDPETAKMLKGLIRSIERNSNADIAYDTGFDSAVSNGWGYWRVLTDYEDDTSFDQCIKIGRIRNPFRVYIDPDHQEPDGSDANWCFISDNITREEFKRTFHDAEEPVAWQEGSIGDEYKNWSTSTHVRIAEYYCYEYQTRTLVALTNGFVGYDDELAPEVLEQIKANPKEWVKNERDVRVRKTLWYKITSHQILDQTEWPGQWIPIVKVIGDEVDIEGKVTYSGIVRDAKDPQRMVNYWETHKTEFIALQPKAPFIMEEGQVEGHESLWRQANTKNSPYLLYKGTTIAGKPAPPPQRQTMPEMSAGLVQATEGASQHMQAVTGIRFDATQQERLYDESGKALRELRHITNIGNFHYIDNHARSLRHTGRIIIDLIPKIYDTRRVLTILREDDSEQTVELDPQQQVPYQQQNDPSGKVRRIFNPKVGYYDVTVTIGPSYATKRSEAADSMLNFLKMLPNTAPLVADLIAKNMDWPGAEEIAERLASQLPPEMQAKAMENLPPEAKGIVSSLMHQLQALKQERDRAAAMLGDKEADREVDRQKIKADFEAKMEQIKGDLIEALIAAQSKPGADPKLEREKIGNDFEAKITKVILDAILKREQMAQERELSEMEMEMDAEQSSAEMMMGAAVEGAKLDSAERTAEADRESGERTAKMSAKSKAKPNGEAKAQGKSGGGDVHIHLPETMKFDPIQVEPAPSKPRKRKATKLRDGEWEISEE